MSMLILKPVTKIRKLVLLAACVTLTKGNYSHSNVLFIYSLFVVIIFLLYFSDQITKLIFFPLTCQSSKIIVSSVLALLRKAYLSAPPPHIFRVN